MTEYRNRTIKIEYAITLPIKDVLYFEIGSYYTMQDEPISNRHNRIRWVSDKRRKTFIDMLCLDIKYNENLATVYFINER
jgi:hypothetical protein